MRCVISFSYITSEISCDNLGITRLLQRVQDIHLTIHNYITIYTTSMREDDDDDDNNSSSKKRMSLMNGNCRMEEQ